MSAIGADTHRTRGFLLNGLGWLVSFAATLALTLAAADRRGGDPDFSAGYAVGRLVAAFAVAFAIGLGIQWGVRKRRTVPAWIGAIAVGVAAVGLLATASESAGAAACLAPAKVYGRPPAGWSYTPVPAARRAEVMRLLKVAKLRRTDVSVARNGSATVVLVAIPGMGQSYVAGWESAAREQHARLTHTAYGASAAEIPARGVRTILGLRGCNAVLVDGRDDGTVDAVARAIFR